MAEVACAELFVASEGTHHTDSNGRPAYARRFQQVLAFHAPGLAPVRDAGRAFHINPDGMDAYPHRFDLTFGFYEGAAAVVDPSGWFHILPTGEPAYAARWLWAGNFQEDRAAVQAQDAAFWHIDREGVPRTGPWAYAGDFSEGTAAVQELGGLWRHIDGGGRFLHPNGFLDVLPFHKGFAVARDGKGWLHVDRHGSAVYAQRYAYLEPFYNGLALATLADGRKVRVNPQGEERPLLYGPGQNAADGAQGMNQPSQGLVARRAA